MKLRWFAIAALLVRAVPISRRGAREVGGEHATARVTMLEASNREDGVGYQPVFEFLDAAGATHTTRGASVSPSLYYPDETVPVVSDASAPDDAPLVGPAIMRGWWYALAVAVAIAIAWPWPLATGARGWRRALEKAVIVPGVIALTAIGVSMDASTTAARIWLGIGSLGFAAFAVLELRAMACPRCTRIGRACCSDPRRIPSARAMWPKAPA